jgi:hypothetical protein
MYCARVGGWPRFWIPRRGRGPDRCRHARNRRQRWPIAQLHIGEDRPWQRFPPSLIRAKSSVWIFRLAQGRLSLPPNLEDDLRREVLWHKAVSLIYTPRQHRIWADLLSCAAG